MAKRAAGTKIRIGANFIAELETIDGLDLSAETIDVTTLDSNGAYREFIGGFKDGGEVALTGFFNPSDVGQDAVYDAFEAGTTDAYAIIFPSALGAQWDFNGVVTGFKTSVEKEGVISFEATVKVSGKPTLSISASADGTALAVTAAGGTLSPTFAAGRYYYTFSGVTAASATITLTAAGQTMKLYVDGVYSQDLTSGAASAAIALTLNVGKKLTIISQEAGKASKVYEVIVVKTT